MSGDKKVPVLDWAPISVKAEQLAAQYPTIFHFLPAGETRGTTEVVPVDEVKAEIARLTEVVKSAEDQGQATVKVQVKSMEQDIVLRKMLANWLLRIFGFANVATIGLFLLTGLGYTQLSDVALLALLTATVAEVAGIMFVVARYLFPQQPTFVPVRVETPVVQTPTT